MCYIHLHEEMQDWNTVHFYVSKGVIEATSTVGGDVYVYKQDVRIRN